jgi:hypothetical protein
MATPSRDDDPSSRPVLDSWISFHPAEGANAPLVLFQGLIRSVGWTRGRDRGDVDACSRQMTGMSCFPAERVVVGRPEDRAGAMPGSRQTGLARGGGAACGGFGRFDGVDEWVV